MSHLNENHHEHGLDEALGGLSNDAGPAPDLTRSIMGRLGYMRVASEVARRRSHSKWYNRAGMLVVAGVALVFGWRVFEASPEIRRPSQTTVPQAIGHDVQQQSERLGTMFRTIREISSPRFSPRVGPARPPESNNPGRQPRIKPAPGSDEGPFSADILTQPGNDPDQPPAEPNLDQSSGQEIRDDVNRTKRTPVRWA